MFNAKTTFPDNFEANAEYLIGKAQNEILEGDGLGSPWHELVINNTILGPISAILWWADITPDGSEEKAGQSQYLDALRILSKDMNWGDRFVGSFARGVTFTDEYSVARGQDGEYYTYVGSDPFPKVVPAGINPSGDVDFEIIEWLSADTIKTNTWSLKSFLDNGVIRTSSVSNLSSGDLNGHTATVELVQYLSDEDIIIETTSFSDGGFNGGAKYKILTTAEKDASPYAGSEGSTCFEINSLGYWACLIIDENTKSSQLGGFTTTTLETVAAFTGRMSFDTNETVASITIPDNLIIEGDGTKTLATGSLTLSDKSILRNVNIDLSSSTNPVSAISANGATKPMLYDCDITGCPLTIECVRFTDTVGGKVIKCDIGDGNRAVVFWGASVACRIRWLRADSQKGISVLLHTGQTATGNLTQSYGHKILNSKITNVGRGDSVTNPEAHGVQIWGMDAAQAARFHDIYDVLVDDVTVETGTGAGIWTSCARRVKVRNCTVNNVRKEGIDFEGSLDCTNIGSDLYNAGRTFGSLTLIFRCDDCWHKNCTVVHDGDFALIGGGEHPLVSSLSVYARDGNVRSGYKGNTFSARNANNKLTSFTVFKSTEDPNSTTGSIGLLCKSNEFLNGVVRYLDNCHKPKIVDNKLEFTGSYAAGTLTKSIYWVNCYEPIVKGNDIELNNGTTDATTSSNNAIIFGLYNANPQRGYGAEIDDNKVRKFSSGITFQNFYSGRDSDGSFKATQNTVPSIFYSSTITDFAIANNYHPDDFSTVAETGI